MVDRVPGPESTQAPRPIVRRNASAQDRLREVHRLARIMCKLAGEDPDAWCGDSDGRAFTDSFSEWNRFGPVTTNADRFLEKADEALTAAEREAAQAAELFR